MHFESVYRVSTRNSVPAAGDVDALGRELGMELPLGYREFVTAFGPGTLSNFLVVYMPSEIRNPDSYRGKCDREQLARLAQYYREEKIEPAISAACPQDKRPTSKSLTAKSTRASVSLIESGRRMVAFVMGLVLLAKAYLRSWPDARGIGLQGEQRPFWPRDSSKSARSAPSLNTAGRLSPRF
jgi:hypothetical protein